MKGQVLVTMTSMVIVLVSVVEKALLMGMKGANLGDSDIDGHMQGRNSFKEAAKSSSMGGKSEYRRILKAICRGILMELTI